MISVLSKRYLFRVISPLKSFTESVKRIDGEMSLNEVQFCRRDIYLDLSLRLENLLRALRIDISKRILVLSKSIDGELSLNEFLFCRRDIYLELSLR
jgi:hypothetical protein